MKIVKRFAKGCCIVVPVLALVWGCPFDNTLREYLSARFWQPFAKTGTSFEKRGVRRMSAPFAGMRKTAGETPLEKLRAAYLPVEQVQAGSIYSTPVRFDAAPLRKALAAARTSQPTSPREIEEIDLIEAKTDLREGQAGGPELLESARQKLVAFLRTVRTPEFRSEARGWLARVYYLQGDQTAAGKIYLDELNRNGSNLGVSKYSSR